LIGANKSSFEYFDGEWTFIGENTVSLASNTVPGIVQGSTGDGQISVNDLDGTMSLSGYSNLVTNTKLQTDYSTTTEISNTYAPIQDPVFSGTPHMLHNGVFTDLIDRITLDSVLNNYLTESNASTTYATKNECLPATAPTPTNPNVYNVTNSTKFTQPVEFDSGLKVVDDIQLLIPKTGSIMNTGFRYATEAQLYKAASIPKRIGIVLTSTNNVTAKNSNFYPDYIRFDKSLMAVKETPHKATIQAYKLGMNIHVFGHLFVQKNLSPATAYPLFGLGSNVFKSVSWNMGTPADGSMDFFYFL
jgi:hypothetical protein